MLSAPCEQVGHGKVEHSRLHARFVCENSFFVVRVLLHNGPHGIRKTFARELSFRWRRQADLEPLEPPRPPTFRWSESSLRHVRVCLETLLDTHFQPTKHDRDDAAHVSAFT